MRKDTEIIFENDDLIAINKPAGMLSIPDRMQSELSLKDMLVDGYGSIYTVHRLDKETSGAILFAKNEHAHRLLSQQFENRETEKFYKALVNGVPEEKTGLVDLPIIEHPVKKGLMVIAEKGKPSVTEYKVDEEFGTYSVIDCKILTGRTHQIRVHMKYIGHPVACDDLYGNGSPIYLSAIKKKFKLSKQEEEERPILGRLALHAYRLVFKDTAGNLIELEAPMPKDLRATISQLRKWRG